ncbi:response regulator [Pleurocapsa sp. FMAR1]|uniref:response regulator n=1 Tax=Pleurocapsa sp. FMAR1 TaxID=3040204 RepID=UPI0029C89EA7|nr:response regulator [Pleurocapsa sp. FMAR1]
MCRSILVVEDNDDISLLLILVLESAGYQVKAISNGKNALETVAQIQPNLILMDIMMPEVSGLEVSREIKTKPNYQSLPILLVSAVDRLQEKQFDDSKADGIIYKPFDLNYLVSRVDELTNVRQAVAS